jgi:hypothetical protein
VESLAVVTRTRLCKSSAPDALKLLPVDMHSKRRLLAHRTVPQKLRAAMGESIVRTANPLQIMVVATVVG